MRLQGRLSHNSKGRTLMLSYFSDYRALTTWIHKLCMMRKHTMIINLNGLLDLVDLNLAADPTKGWLLCYLLDTRPTTKIVICQSRSQIMMISCLLTISRFLHVHNCTSIREDKQGLTIRSTHHSNHLVTLMTTTSFTTYKCKYFYAYCGNA